MTQSYGLIGYIPATYGHYEPRIQISIVYLFSAWVPRELVSEAESTHQIKIVGACWCNACWSLMKSRLVFCSNFWVFFSDLGSPFRSSSSAINWIQGWKWDPKNGMNSDTHTHRITQIYGNSIHEAVSYHKDKDLHFGAIPFSREAQLLFVVDSSTETGVQLVLGCEPPRSPGMIKDC